MCLAFFAKQKKKKQKKKQYDVECMKQSASLCIKMNQYSEVLFHNKTLTSISFPVADSHISLLVISTGRKFSFQRIFSGKQTVECRVQMRPKRGTIIAKKTWLSATGRAGGPPKRLLPACPLEFSTKQ